MEYKNFATISCLWPYKSWEEINPRQISTYGETLRRKNILSFFFELYLSKTLKQWENSLQYSYFRHASRSRLELGECLQAGCLQGGDEELEHGREAYSLNNLLREVEDRLVDAVNSFAELKSAWVRYTAAVSMFLSVQYAIIRIMLFAVFLKYGVSKFSRVLLSAVYLDLYGVVDWKPIQRIYEPRSIEMEPMLKNTSDIHNGVSALC